MDVRTILNSKSFRLPKMNARVPEERGLVSSAVNYIERKTGFDIDRDGDIGLPGDPIDKQNQIALNGLRWVIDNVRYTLLNDSGKDTDFGLIIECGISLKRQLLKLRPQYLPPKISHLVIRH